MDIEYVDSIIHGQDITIEFFDGANIIDYRYTIIELKEALTEIGIRIVDFFSKTQKELALKHLIKKDMIQAELEFQLLMIELK